MISKSPAVRRITKNMELAQIWITDDKLGDLEKEQRTRMKKQFRTNAIPLHVVLDPFTNEELARIVYDPLMTAADYVKDFLEPGVAKFEAAQRARDAAEKAAQDAGAPRETGSAVK